MKYVKPLQLFMEMRKPKANYSVIGLVNTARHVCMSIVSSDGGTMPLDDHPRKTECTVERLSHYQDELNDRQKLLGIVVGKNRVGAPMNILVDNLCKTGKFKSLKYTYWVDNIMSVGAPLDMLLDDLCKPVTQSSLHDCRRSNTVYRRPDSEFNLNLRTCRDTLGHLSLNYTKGFSSFRMLLGYMDFCQTFVERRKGDVIFIPSDEENSDDEEDEEAPK